MGGPHYPDDLHLSEVSAHRAALKCSAAGISEEHSSPDEDGRRKGGFFPL